MYNDNYQVICCRQGKLSYPSAYGSLLYVCFGEYNLPLFLKRECIFFKLKSKKLSKLKYINKKAEGSPCVSMLSLQMNTCGSSRAVSGPA